MRIIQPEVFVRKIPIERLGAAIEKDLEVNGNISG